MAKAIEQAKEGDRINKLWSKLNEVIGVTNALSNAEVKFTDPGSGAEGKPEGKLLVSDANAVLNLKIKNGLPPFPDDTSGRFALVASYNGGWTVDWVKVCSEADTGALATD
jgi:hypothetical protein